MKELINDKEPEFICDKCNKPIYDITELDRDWETL